MLTAYFINSDDTFSYVNNNVNLSSKNIEDKINDKAKLLLRVVFIFCMVILMSSCTTKYPDVQRSASSVGRFVESSVGNSRPVSSRRVSRPVAPVRESSVKNSVINTQPQQSEVTSEIISEVIEVPKQIVNISSLNNWLFEASEQGDVNAIWRLLEQGADIAASNTNGETALHSAAAHNQVDAARLLIEKGADVNARTISGWSPLHSAARFGSTDVVSILLQSGSDRYHRNNTGRTALSLAQQAQHTAVIRVLKNR